MDRPIYEVSPKDAPIESLDLLCYFYYGGIALVGLKKMKEASDAFHTVTATLSCCKMAC
jgi:hypothetical protein